MRQKNNYWILRLNAVCGPAGKEIISSIYQMTRGVICVSEDMTLPIEPMDLPAFNIPIPRFAGKRVVDPHFSPAAPFMLTVGAALFSTEEALL